MCMMWNDVCVNMSLNLKMFIEVFNYCTFCSLTGSSSAPQRNVQCPEKGEDGGGEKAVPHTWSKSTRPLH